MIFNKTHLTAICGIIIIFCVGLVFFFSFAEPYGDGLERTMEEGGVEEREPAYSAPLDYGDNYFTALLMGIIGFVLVLFILLFLTKIMRKKDETRND
ncbi:MAG: hypothetical protein JSV56_00595 [Methanomassiliicoccales archaeon]|nr:MAG: hypothetical protein JSV56_00595 [Methanomassiliicoccales archaeon]